MISLIGKKNKECEKFYSKFMTCLYVHSFEGVHSFFECEKYEGEYYQCLRFVKNKKFYDKKHESNKIKN